MIEIYLNTARRTKATSEALVAQYESYYEHIKAQISPVGGYPELHVTYSSERRCELLRLKGRQYLVYDQYLGQSFNRINRIQFAKHESPSLSMAYASKFIAERLIALNALGPAVFFGLISKQFEKLAHAPGNPFADLGEDEYLRHRLIAAQELFVMAHEVAHHRWALDQSNLTNEISGNIDAFLKSRVQSEHPTDASMSLSSYYKSTYVDAGPEFLEELFADDFGGIVAMRVATLLGVQPWEASLGAILAFKYLRLFRHLDIIAQGVASLASSTSDSDFQAKLKALENDIWDAKTKDVARFQFREHFLRYRLGEARKSLPNYGGTGDAKIVSVVGEYDEKTEFPATIGLIDRLTATLSPSLLLELDAKINKTTNGQHHADKLTGWQR